MSKRVLVLVLLLAILAAVGAWRMGWLATTPAPAVAVKPRAAAPPRFQAAWATEQEWLVDRITRDIRAMAAFATKQPLPAADAPAVNPQTLRFEEHLFSPRAYEPIAREALGAQTSPAAPVPRDSREEDARLLSALLDPQANVLVREDQALSRRLEAEPREPGAHERAALLLGAFALRDRAGRSTDTRPALMRITAHLAFAGALRSGAEPELAGRYAEAVLATLVGREKDALARVDALAAAAPRPTERAWLRALRLRNTGDWRIARDEKRLTLLEKLEEFRALVGGMDDLAAVAWLDKRSPEPIPDWGLIALGGRGYSVQTGNRFADLTPMLELAQAGEVLARLRGAPTEGTGFLDALNERPAGLVSPDAGGEARIAVLGWGLWADRCQRSLVFSLATGVGHRHGLGQPGESRAFAEQSRERFSRIEMYPIVLRAHAEEPEQYRAAMAAVRELALHSPERLTGGHWNLIRFKEDFAPVPKDLPDENTWFQPALPRGTLLDADWRSETLNGLVSVKPEELAALRALAPHNVPLARLEASRVPADKRSPSVLAPIYGPLAEFHVESMAALAQASWYDPADYRARQGALCEILAEKCFMFGYRLAELGFPDEAAVAYQKGFDRADDRVAAANSSRWLVDYYFDHGQTKKAEAVAREAAEVYSGPGLFTMARLMERMGRLREAEEYYLRLRERYGAGNALAGFYYRQARVEKKPAYEVKLRDALAQALPSGLEPLDRASLPAHPSDGVVVRGENDNTLSCRIKWGHVIVGLDGFRIRDLRSWEVVRALSQAPRMELLVWRGTSYDDVKAELWDRNFRVALETLGPSK